MTHGPRISRLFRTGLVLYGLGTAATPVAAAPSPDFAAAKVRLDSLWAAGHHEEFRAALRVDMATASARRDTTGLVRFLTLGGARDVSVGRAVQAEESLRRGIALARAARDTAGEVPALRWLGVALGLQGRFEDSATTCRELLSLARLTGDRRHQGWAHVGLAYSAMQRGTVEEAQHEYEAAGRDLREAEDAQGEIWAGNGLAMTWSRRGDLRRALAAYLDLAARANELGYPMAEALAVNNAGHCRYLLGDPGGARDSFERARRLQEGLGQVREALVPTINLALCLEDLGRTDAAADTLRRCLERSLELGYVDLAGEAVVEEANLERRAGHPHAAAAIARRALALGERLPAQDRGRAALALGQALADVDSAAAALDCLDRARAGIPPDALGTVAQDMDLARARALAAVGEVRTATAVLDRLVAAAEAAGDDRVMMLACLQRGRLLAAGGRRVEARDALRKGLDAWERERSLPIQPEWRESRGSAGRAIALELAGLILDGDTPTAVEDAYRVLETYKARTLLERRLGPGVAIPSERASVSLDSLRTAVLRDDECFLDLYLGDRRGFLVAVAPDTVAVFRLNPDGDLEARARALVRVLSTAPEAGADEDRAAVLRTGMSGLRHELLDPAAAITEGRHHVVVAADGIVHALPIEPWSQGGASASTWSRTPSAGVLARIRSEAPPPAVSAANPVILAVVDTLPDGRALPGVREESRRLQRRFDGVVHRAGRDLRHAYPAASIVHVASHAELDDQAPWRSALLVDGDATGGTWRADSIAAVPTEAGLVVLSSCSTARGRMLSGEGLVGLSSAFLAGGAHAVVGTLWPIDDRAGARFMDRFYGHLAAPGGVADALSRARLDMSRDPTWSDPFYWAGYVVIGDGALAVEAPEPAGGPGRGRDIAAAVLAALFLFAGVGLVRRARKSRSGSDGAPPGQGG